MVAAENYVAELDTKNQTSIQRVVDALSAALGKDGVEVADAVRFALKATIETAEVAALWITDCDDLEMKLSLAEQCGDSARQCRKLSERLGPTGRRRIRPARRRLLEAVRVPALAADDRGALVGGLPDRPALSMARLGALAGFCERKGDGDSARLLGVEITDAGAALLRAGQADAGRRGRDRGEPGARAPRRIPDARARGRDRRAAAAPQGARQTPDASAERDADCSRTPSAPMSIV